MPLAWQSSASGESQSSRNAGCPVEYVQPAVGTRRVLDGSFMRKQRGVSPDVSWGPVVVLSHSRV